MKSQILSLVISDRDELHNHYLPMVMGGGIFVPTESDLDFGDKVVVQVELMFEKQKAMVPGKVVWTTPVGAQRSLMKGIGVQIIGKNRGRIQQYFESLLVEQLSGVPSAPCY